MSAVAEKVAEMVAPSLGAMGYHIVQVRLIDGKQRTLQLMAERADEADMSVDDCEAISRTVSALLDVEDPIDGAYHLEVSSPGIDRPLVKPEDYIRFTGSEAKVETTLPIDGRRRFKGVIAAADEKEVTMECDGVKTNIPYSNVNFAKLVLTDELVRDHLRQAKKKEKKAE